MNIPQEQIDELKTLFPALLAGEEGGTTFFLIPAMELPEGTNPNRVDALLCPSPRNGYESRLYFSERIQHGGTGTNWNGPVHILGRNWYVYSWRTRAGLRLAQMISEHLRGLKK